MNVAPPSSSCPTPTPPEPDPDGTLPLSGRQGTVSGKDPDDVMPLGGGHGPQPAPGQGCPGPDDPLPPPVDALEIAPAPDLFAPPAGPTGHLRAVHRSAQHGLDVPAVLDRPVRHRA